MVLRRSSRRGGHLLAELRREQGLSLVETLIAAAMLLIVAIGVLPLFTRALSHNIAGRESTMVSNMAKSEVEEMVQIPFDSALLVLGAGQTENGVEEYWSETQRRWLTTLPSTDKTTWVRSTIVRQYSINDLEDDAVFNTPLDGAALPGFVHLKEIEVQVWNARGNGPLGGGKRLTLKMLKAK